MKRSPVSLLVTIVCLGGWLVGQGTAFAFQQPSRERLPDLDKRQGDAVATKAAPAAKTTAVARLGVAQPGVTVDFDPVTGAPKWIVVQGGFLTGPDGSGISSAARAAVGNQDPNRVTKAFIQENQDLFGHGPAVLDAARVKREFVGAHNGLRTVVWEQQVDEIPVFESALISHTTKQGELVSLSSTFLPDLTTAADAGTPGRTALQAAPAISARQAVALAAGNLAESVKEDAVKEITTATGAEQRQQFRAPGLNGDVNVNLTWLPMNAGSLRLCWDVILTSQTRGEMFRVLVDLKSGEILLRRCLTEYISDATYRVYPSDSPSPFSPGNPTPLTNQPPTVLPVLIVTNAFSTNASPNGWIDDGVNETRGNNVDAHTDRDGNDSADLPRPQGTPFRVFDFSSDLTQAPSTYSNASVVQLFFLCNWYHDRLYELGFNEAAGNFQVNNFGRGGLGNDAVQADAQDGGGTDNANFSTPPDGASGRMQMFIWTGASPDRDGSLDAEIVFHEHTHGLSNRRVGGGVGLSALQSRGMGEGWSDFYALALLSEPGDNVNGIYASGGYVSYKIDPTYTQNYYFGIRRFPYTTDLTRNPLTFNDIDPAQVNFCSAGDPFSPVSFLNPCGSSADEVHNQGEVWCAILWEARANLINKHGWAVGNQLSLQLVTDGMNLSPANPNFVQARDAILQADRVNTGGANQMTLWAAFAKRGLGFGATSPASSTTAGLHESFDPPDDLRITPNAGFVSSGPVGGSFAPKSQNFSLSNAGSNAFNWSLVNTSFWLNVSATGGTLSPGGAATSVTASLDALVSTLPMGVYDATLLFTNQTSGVGQGRAFSLRVGQPDFFTEEFTAGDFDLAFSTFTFTPNGSSSFYSVCREPATSFPTPTTGSTTVTLLDDDYLSVSLSGTNTVALYNRRTNVFFIGSNGYLTMDSGDAQYLVTRANHFNRPRISGLFTDLNAPGGGTISWKQTAQLVAVTFLNVPEYGGTRTVNFQIEWFFDGRIRLTYLAVGLTDGVVGLSAGAGVPAGYAESDFRSYGPCRPPLFVTVPASATEGDGLLAGAGHVYLAAPLATNLLVTLSSVLPGEVTVSNTVVLAGQTNAAFDLFVPDDSDLDGSKVAGIVAAATGFNSGSAAITIFDNEKTGLHVNLPATVQEGDGNVPGVVWLDAAPKVNVRVNLTSSDPTELQVPASVYFLAGQTSLVFTASVVDDTQIDGPQTATVTAHVENWADGTAVVTVRDNESLNLLVTLPAAAYESAGVLTNAGRVSLAGTLATNLIVTLTSSDLTELTVPASVTIPAGQFSAAFNLTLVDDPLVDGAQNVIVTAAATGFTNGAASISVLDDETPPEPSQPSPPHLATNVSAQVNLAWQTGAETELVVNGGFESHDFTGWVRLPSAFGNFEINDGVMDWSSPDAPLPPYEGSFSALATQTGGGVHSLYQDVKIPVGATGVMLRWAHRVRNFSTDFSTNQQFRVEIRNPSNVLLAVPFTTNPGDALLGDWVNRSFDLTPFAGQTIRLTFAVTPNDYYLDVHVDSVSIRSPNQGLPITNDVYFGTSPTPGPAQLLGSTTNATWDLPQLAPLTTYYWQVVAHRIGTTPGPVWQFSTKGVDHFDWSTIPSPRLVGKPFAATITARDEFGSAVSNFTGTVRISGSAGSNTVSLFAENFEDGNFLGWDDNGGDYIRAVTNATAAAGLNSFTLIGGNQTHYDGVSHSLPDLKPARVEFHVRASSASLAGGYVVLRSGVQMVAFFYMNDLGEMGIYEDVGGWHAAPYQAEKWYQVTLQLNWANRSMDYYVDGALIEAGIPFRSSTAASLSDVYLYNFHATQSWWDEFHFFQDGVASPISLTPTNSGNFSHGAWTGNLTVLQTATDLRLRAADAAGHFGVSNPFDVFLENDLLLSITDSPDPVAPDNYLTNVIQVYNSGPNTARRVNLTNLLPASVSFVSAVASQGSVVFADGKVWGNVGTLPGGAAATLTVVGVPTVPGPITNWAFVGRSGLDGDPANNSAMSVTHVLMPALSISDVSLREGNSGVANALFRVSLHPPTLHSVLVSFSTHNGSATAGSDFIGTNGVLIFDPGQTNQFLPVPVLGDTVFEPNETFSVTLAGSVNAVLAKAVGVGTIINDDALTLPEAVDATQLVWTTGGAVPWLPQTYFTHDGQDAAESGYIFDLEQTWMQTTVVGPGSLSFWWKVSSEATYDFLEFYNNSTTPSARISGEVDWQFRTVVITAGTHTLRWRYFKDDYVSDGYDAAWVDQVTYVPSAPMITRQPANQLADVGGTATFTVAAIGVAPLSYQWRFNGVAISNATTSALSLTGLTTNQAGAYSVIVSNVGGIALSTDAILSVAEAGSIFFDDFEPGVDTRQWSRFGGVIGSTMLATNYGGSVSPVNSLWFNNSGSRHATTRALNTTNGGFISFYLHLADGFALPWEMPDLPAQGVVLEFSTNLTLNYQIIGRYDTPEFYNWTPVTLPIPTEARLPSVYFRWRQLTNSGIGFDNWALDDTLIARDAPAPVFTLEPVSLRVNQGDTATFSAAASGLAPLLYQWRHDGHDLPGATGTTLTISNAQPGHAGSYVVRVSNLIGSVTSSNALLQVNQPPVTFSQAVSGLEDLPLKITLLAADPQGDPLTYTVVTPPAHGALNGTGPNVVYQPALNYNGPDSFTFRVSDGFFVSDVATVSITVLPVNDAPVAIARAFPLVFIALTDPVGVIISPNNSTAGVLLDGSQSWDVDGDPLTYAWFELGRTHSLGSGVVVSNLMRVGTHRIELVVSDGFATGTNRIEVPIITAAEAVERVIAMVEALHLDSHDRRELLKILEEAQSDFARRNFSGGVKNLADFQSEVRRRLAHDEAATAAALIRAAQVIRDAIPAAGHDHDSDSHGDCDRIAKVTRRDNGHLRVEFGGAPWRTHLVQASTNLVDWETIGAGAEVADGVFEFEDAKGANYKTRFYRTVVLP